MECHDTWCHHLTSFLVEEDVKMLWKCHDDLMEFNRMFLWEKGIPVKCHENVMKFQCHSMGLKIQVHFDILWKKSMELSWHLTSFWSKTRMGSNDGILVWGDVNFYDEILEHHVKNVFMYFPCISKLFYSSFSFWVHPHYDSGNLFILDCSIVIYYYAL